MIGPRVVLLCWLPLGCIRLIGSVLCRWSKSNDPKVRKRAAKKVAAAARKKAAMHAGATDKFHAESEMETGVPTSRKLYHLLEFRGTCVRNKEGKFPCPTKGFLLDRGVSTEFLEITVLMNHSQKLYPYFPMASCSKPLSPPPTLHFILAGFSLPQGQLFLSEPPATPFHNLSSSINSDSLPPPLMPCFLSTRWFSPIPISPALPSILPFI